MCPCLCGLNMDKIQILHSVVCRGCRLVSPLGSVGRAWPVLVPLEANCDIGCGHQNVLLDKNDI